MSDLTRTQKIQLIKAIQERKARRDAYPLAHIQLHDKQRALIDGLKERRVAIYSGGNRSGKTFVAACVLVAYAYGYWIWDAAADGINVEGPEGDYAPRSAIPPRYWIRRVDGLPLREQRRLVVVTGLSLVKGIGNILWPEIESKIPAAVRGRLKVARGALSVPMSASHPDGVWTIDFGSVEQAQMALEGAKHDFAAFDEPPTRTSFTAVWRGLIDYRASLLMTFTPLGAHAPWLYEEFYAGERDDVAIVTGSQSDNPHLSSEALADFERGVNFSEEELLARKSGEFGFLTHRAFHVLNPDVHFIPPFDIPREWPRMCVCDPASRRPFFFLWLAYDVKRKTWIAYREFPQDRPHHTYRNSEWTIQDYATIIRNMEGDERIDARVIDPRFGPAEYTVKGEKTTSVCDDFAKYGLYFDARVPDTGREETGIERIRQLLWFDPRHGIGPNNRPHLLFFDDLKSTTHAMRNYAFVPPNARDDRVLSEKTQEAFKDPVDAVRYGVLYGPPVAAHTAPNSYIPERDWLGTNDIDDDWL